MKYLISNKKETHAINISNNNRAMFKPIMKMITKIFACKCVLEVNLIKTSIENHKASDRTNSLKACKRMGGNG